MLLAVAVLAYTAFVSLHQQWRDTYGTANHEAGHVVYGWFSASIFIRGVTIVPYDDTFGETWPAASPTAAHPDSLWEDCAFSAAGYEASRITRHRNSNSAAFGDSYDFDAMTEDLVKLIEIGHGDRSSMPRPPWAKDRPLPSEDVPLIQVCQDRASSIVSQHGQLVTKVADALMANDVLDHEDLLEMLGTPGPRP